MKYLHLSLLLLTVFVICFVAACSSGPSQMFTLAQKARAEATEVQADQFATDLWVAAEQAWQEGNANLEAKKRGEADKHFLKAKTEFVKARDSAKSKRDNLISQINSMLGTVNIRLKTDLTENPAAKNLSAARKKEFDEEVKKIEDASASIAKQVEGGQIVEAKVLVDKTIRAIYEVQQEYLKK